MRTRLLLPVLGVTVLVLVAAGCGGASRNAGATSQVTVPAYGVFPATTISGPVDGRSRSAACRGDAASFADDSADFLAHFGPSAAYPADLNYVIIRGDLADFRASRCDPRLLGRALWRKLTPKQRAEFVADLPRAMAAIVGEALARPS
jgi:hypothetical protein